jgi:hypothetical protein
MYPAHLFNLFPPFPREEKVFVVMSFASQFQERWNNVIAPAIRDVGLESFRVDVRKISDSIMTDITKAISNHRLIFADISVMFIHEDGGRKYPVRNANVMYEVGLAQAVRLPEEVVLFRSDDKDLPFDVMNIRVNSYDPEGSPDEARAKVRDALQEALREVDQSKQLAVESAARRLVFAGYTVLVEAMNQGEVRSPTVKTEGEVLSNMFRIPAINALIEQGLLISDPLVMTPGTLENLKADEQVENLQAEKLMTYRVTPLGEAVFRAVNSKIFSPARQGKILQVTRKDGKLVDLGIIEPNEVEGKPPAVGVIFLDR